MLNKKFDLNLEGEMQLMNKTFDIGHTVIDMSVEEIKEAIKKYYYQDFLMYEHISSKF